MCEKRFRRCWEQGTEPPVPTGCIAGWHKNKHACIASSWPNEGMMCYVPLQGSWNCDVCCMCVLGPKGGIGDFIACTVACKEKAAGKNTTNKQIYILILNTIFFFYNDDLQLQTARTSSSKVYQLWVNGYDQEINWAWIHVLQKSGWSSGGSWATIDNWRTPLNPVTFDCPLVIAAEEIGSRSPLQLQEEEEYAVDFQVFHGQLDSQFTKTPDKKYTKSTFPHTLFLAGPQIRLIFGQCFHVHLCWYWFQHSSHCSLLIVCMDSQGSLHGGSHH